ncbi:hypothetical protein EOD41_13555 [Mucilaginibacter limnophilus]|uniref:Uncharacterized protein n=1 Tax=Mucilaginibacter limnophilus TaxID=1932778 RepID=A0A3S2UMZ5_9SPHI|nr:hypothetical protein [Mucilaginibacter limnophilus]RVT99986.1 hypothetical protein EOD41_13555 [Mucilaginibacter limnophilus]
MATQFITNDKGERTAVIVPISEYENMLHLHHASLELTEDYKSMMDRMLEQEVNDEAQYVSADVIKERFRKK